MKDSTKVSGWDPLVRNLFDVLAAHRGAFGQERTYERGLGLVFGQLFNFGRHTVSQDLLSLGITAEDWSAWYRLFSRERFDEQELAEYLLAETLKEVSSGEPYVVAVDGTALHRSSQKMAGTAWLRDSRFSAFRPGIHRAQRFLHGAWLTPLEDGFSRAIPLRFLPAFPEKAVAAEAPARREWAAAREFLEWLRGALDRLGRKEQIVLTLTDGGF